MGLSRPEDSESSTDPGQPPQEEVKYVACPRREYSDTHKDWVTFADERLRNFDVCPTCYHGSIAHTSHAKFFIDAPPRADNISVRCDFALNWVRMAWALLLAARADNPSLIAAVAGVQGQEGDCANGVLAGPENKVETTRMWYTIKHPKTGAILSDFVVCDYCLAVIYTMLPNLGAQQVFVTAVAMPVKGCCDMSRSTRSYKYLDMLIDAATEAEKSGGAADLTAMGDYIAKWGGMAECQGDGDAKGKHYFPAQIPDLTACEVCYFTVVEPLAQQAALAQGWESQKGPFRCSLYSERTRKNWQSAAQSGDIAGLHQKAVERKVKREEIVGNIDLLKSKLQQERAQVKTYQDMALLAQQSAMSTVLAATMGGFSAIVRVLT
jgi:hypothetical protein